MVKWRRRIIGTRGERVRGLDPMTGAIGRADTPMTRRPATLLTLDRLKLAMVRNRSTLNRGTSSTTDRRRTPGRSATTRGR